MDNALYGISIAPFRNHNRETPVAKASRLAADLRALGLSVQVHIGGAITAVEADGMFFDYIVTDGEADALAVIDVIDGQRTLIPVKSINDLKEIKERLNRQAP